MAIDSATLSAVFIAVASAAGWGVTQLNARSKAQRAELKTLRRTDILRRRYQHRLEATLASKDLDLPPKPDGLDEDDDLEDA